MNLLRISLLLATTLSAAAAPLLRKPLPIDIGAAANVDAGPLVSADFNGDGFTDVALMHTDGRVAVALSDPIGPFAATKISTIPIEITSAAAGDLDDDDDVDLVYVTETTIGTLLGNGDGTFTAGVADLASSGGVVAIGDFNADGKLDAVAANTDADIASTFSLHFGDGDGGLSAAVTTSLADAAESVFAGKFDGDAMDDIAIVSLDATRVFLARPGGSTEQMPNLDGGVTLAIGLFDADAINDLAIVHVVDREASLVIRPGVGDGTFTQGAIYPLAEDGPIACADVDGDGLNDLLSTSAVTSFFKGLGTGAFADPKFSPVASDPQFALADFDRDNDLDLVTLQPAPAFLELVSGHGDGTFGIDAMFVAHTPPVLDDEAPGAIADMNGDARPDVIVLVDRPDLTRDIAVMRNDGTGGLLAPALTATGMTNAEPTHLAVGRVNADAFYDVVVIGTEAGVEKATVFLGSADGTLTRGTSINAVFPDAAPAPRLIDVTNDGKVDLLFDWSLYPGDGAGSFGAEVVRPLTAHVIADFNGDGLRDTVGFQDVDAPRLGITLNGSNTPLLFGIGNDEIPYAAGDFNGDGLVDLFCMTDTPATRVYPGQGDGTFGAPIGVFVPLFAEEHEVAVTDFDGDGKLDVSFSSAILLGNGDGRFRALEIGSSGFEASGVADFDGNGTPDVASFGDLTTIHLTGLVPEATHDAIATLNTTVAIPAPVTATARIAGELVPPTGIALFTFDGAPLAIRMLQGAAATAPESASAATFASSPPSGTHTFGVVHPGDARYKPSSASQSVFVPEQPGTTVRVTATANGTNVAITWTPRNGASGYVVYRRNSWSGGWAAFFTTTSAGVLSTSDTIPANATRMYAVAPIFGATPGARSTPDIATSVTFTDATLSGAKIKAAHINELRTAVNAVRTFAGLTPLAFPNAIVSGNKILRQHVTELRTGLSQARNTIAMPQTLSAMTNIIRALHLEELRSGVR